MLAQNRRAEARDQQLIASKFLAGPLRQGVAAATLATAAQEFGQEDDITVLTVRSVPA